MGRLKALALSVTLACGLIMGAPQSASAAIAYSIGLKVSGTNNHVVLGDTYQSRQSWSVSMDIYENGDIHVTKVVNESHVTTPGFDDCASPPNGPYNGTPAVRNFAQSIVSKQNDGSNSNVVWSVADPVGNLNVGNNCKITRVFNPDKIVHQERMVSLWSYVIRWAGGDNEFDQVVMTVFHPEGSVTALDWFCSPNPCTSFA